MPFPVAWPQPGRSQDIWGQRQHVFVLGQQKRIQQSFCRLLEPSKIISEGKLPGSGDHHNVLRVFRGQIPVFPGLLH